MGHQEIAQRFLDCGEVAATGFYRWAVDHADIGGWIILGLLSLLAISWLAGRVSASGPHH
ncbi:hypothetical protein AMJ57_01635 [Parcubacteria bacterium SG8_24]|nr:MAG: hypothetical protein AMJ57_01635 [Parcubacteria bacterium SG8_24]